MNSALDLFAHAASVDMVKPSARDAMAEVAPLLANVRDLKADPWQLRVCLLAGAAMRLATAFDVVDVLTAAPQIVVYWAPESVLARLDEFVARVADLAERGRPDRTPAQTALGIVSDVAALVDRLDALPLVLAGFADEPAVMPRATAPRPTAAPHLTRNRRKADRRARRGSK